MKIFKKHADQTSLDQEKLAKRFVLFCLHKQNQLALYLSQHFERLSPAQKKFLLVSYISLFTIISLYIIIDALDFKNIK